MLPRAHTLARFVATLLIALWATQPLGMALHVAEHAHRFCPQHQTFEESARGTLPGLSRLGERAPTISSLPAALADSTRPNHEECPLLNGGPRVEAACAPSAPRVLADLAVSHPATAPPQPFAPLSVLTTAPKASPPARPSFA